MSIKRRLLRAKLHRVTVTQADLDYEGSLTIPPDLMQLADIVEYEAISVWNVTNGSRFETYAINGLKNSRDICVNGAAAHHASPGDKLIIACFCEVNEQDIRTHKPKLVFIDDKNDPKVLEKEIPGPQRRSSNAWTL